MDSRSEMLVKIVVDQNRCASAGQCVLAAAEIFDQRDEDGVVILLQERPAPDLHSKAREAANLCPSRAITIEDV